MTSECIVMQIRLPFKVTVEYLHINLLARRIFVKRCLNFVVTADAMKPHIYVYAIHHSLYIY